MKPYTLHLRHYRKSAGLSVKELAFVLGVTTATIENYESGRTLPPMETVIRLAHILSVTTDQLLGYSIPTK